MRGESTKLVKIIEKSKSRGIFSEEIFPGDVCSLLDFFDFVSGKKERSPTSRKEISNRIHLGL